MTSSVRQPPKTPATSTRTSKGTKMKIRRGLRDAGWAGVLGVTIALFALPSLVASAATLDGTATITNPSNGLPLGSGGSQEPSSTVFTIDLPAQAACSGDTATDGYHVFSYLLAQGTTVTTDSFSSGFPSEGLGLFYSKGYYGSANTAPTTGQVIDIPTDFDFADLLSHGQTAATLDGGSTLSWEAGLACAQPNGTVSDYWNTVVTFTASGTDPNGFTWSAVPGPDTSTPEAAWAVTLPIAGVAVLGGGLWFSRRRSRKKALVVASTVR
jgi:LPXTG-motif cell wall-anchored protein